MADKPTVPFQAKPATTHPPAAAGGEGKGANTEPAKPAEPSSPQTPANDPTPPSPWAALVLELVESQFHQLCSSLRLTDSEISWVSSRLYER